MNPVVPAARTLAGYFLAAQHPVTRRWLDDVTRLDILTEQCAEDVLLATDIQLAAERSRMFAPEHPPEAFLNHWAPANDDLHAMFSMRYEGGDPGKPFVDATISSRPFTSADLPGLAEAAAHVYGLLGPRYLRLWSAEPADRFPTARPDRRFLAAPVRDLRAGVDRPVPVELRLTRARSVQHYEDARAAYADVDQEHRAHAEQAAIAGYEDLSRSLTAGTLFDITVDGEWAGYVAVKTTGESLGLPAYVVHELILATTFRGHGYGAHLTTLLARALPDEERILVGTIHADNRGARQAAERAGRVDIGGWIQVPLTAAFD